MGQRRRADTGVSAESGRESAQMGTLRVVAEAVLAEIESITAENDPFWPLAILGANFNFWIVNRSSKLDDRLRC